jgi:hypothetical protein
MTEGLQEKSWCNLLDEYIERYPIYESVLFGTENLPSLLILTQYIIDKLIENGKKRIAIILPDDGCNMIPLIVAKCFCNVIYEPSYAPNVLDEVRQGQHLKFGGSEGAVVKFISILDGWIKIIAGGGKGKEKRDNPETECLFPISENYLFDKCDEKISKMKKFKEIYKNYKNASNEKNFKSINMTEEIRKKKTTLKKTMLLLSKKEEFKEFIKNLSVNSYDFQDLIAYGEVIENGFNLLNGGKLDCLPALAVTARLVEINTLLKTSLKEKIFAIFATSDKFNELVNNTDTLKKCLLQNVPFVVFVPESSFEEYPLLADANFEMWHWKPSMMRSKAFSQENTSVKSQPLFGKLSAKINRAVDATFDIKKCNEESLKTTFRDIKRLSDCTQDWDSHMRKMLHKILILHSKFRWLLCPLQEVANRFNQELNEIKALWQERKIHYSGQDAARIIDSIIDSYDHNINIDNLSGKSKLVSDIVKSNDLLDITVLVSDEYEYLQVTESWLAEITQKNRIIQILKLSDFYAEQEKEFKHIDWLIITWFDWFNKKEYIKIKQTYCYKKLTFLLYDFENKWREGFISKIDKCLPHEVVRKNAANIGLSEQDYSDVPVSSISESYVEYKEIEDYNVTKTIIKSIIRSGKVDENASDSVEVVQILLAGDYIGYFYPTRYIIDVSGLFSGDSNRSLKKKACELRKGDNILVRQSEKDIIKEKADDFLQKDNKSDLRRLSEIWYNALCIYAEGKSVDTVCQGLKCNGGDCTEQKVRYWLAGETICPTDKTVVTAILQVVKNKLNIENVDKTVELIFAAGREVRTYHQKVGLWLNSALKNKTNEIIDITKTYGAASRGKIEGIGEICIYTVEDILDKDFVSRKKLNKVEALF